MGIQRNFKILGYPVSGLFGKLLLDYVSLSACVCELPSPPIWV